MVVTDSAHLKKGLVEDYSSVDVRDLSGGPTNKTILPIPRQVLTTQSRGKHTRTYRRPSTADFAEALIDWYLIGESDAIATERTVFSSFETTAALRTNRPVYITPSSKNGEISQCRERVWLRD
jgi:hypothetical protein